MGNPARTKYRVLQWNDKFFAQKSQNSQTSIRNNLGEWEDLGTKSGYNNTINKRWFFSKEEAIIFVEKQRAADLKKPVVVYETL